jgi:hypothetical protein
MPAAEYETRTDSVLAWKKAQKLGRFDPDAPSIEQQKILASEREIEERGKQTLSLLVYILCPPILYPSRLLYTATDVASHCTHGGERNRNEPALGMNIIKGIPP